MIVAGGVLAVVALVLLARRGRRDQVQRVQVAGPKPWAGPAFLNGSVRVRAPGEIPRPVLLLARERRAARRRVSVKVVALGVVAVGLWWHVLGGLS